MISDFIFKNLLIFIILLFVIFLLLFLEISNIIEAKNFITIQESLRLININKAIIIDLRLSADFKLGCINNSINIPFDNLKQNITILNKYKEKTIIFIYYENTDVLKFIKQYNINTFLNVKLFKDGIKEWIKNDIPLKLL